MTDRRLLAAACALVLVACSTPSNAGSSSEQPTDADSAPATVAPVTTEAIPSTVTWVDTTVARSTWADSVKELDNALYQPPAAPASAPVGLSIPALGIETAPVVGVGVADGGDMEIPRATEVGWYRFSPRPGEDGSAVLAAHIAYDGQPGVFRHLSSIEVGALVDVVFEDGAVRRFEVSGIEQYAKDELPADRVFAKSGDPVLVLITCGGTFNRTLRSYQDNVVAYATPVS